MTRLTSPPTKICRQPTPVLARVIIGTVILLTGTVVHPQPAEEVRYVQATELRLRSGPTVNAPSIALLHLNEQVELTGAASNSNWCPIIVRAGSMQGWVDCSHLGANPLSLEQADAEIARLSLALQRTTDPKASRELAERLFSQLERRFTLSPSLHTVADYDSLLGWLNRGQASPADDPGLKVTIQSHGQGLARMRQQLARTDTTLPWPDAHYPATATLRTILSRRLPGSAARRGERRAEALARSTNDAAPAPRASLFRDGAWAIGWAGGPLAHRQSRRDAEGVVYSIGFDGPSYRTLAALYEMAKSQRIAVQLEFKSVSGKGELSQSAAIADGGPEGLVLRTHLPVWGITEKGLVPGILRHASYGGDECSASENRSLPTRVEVVFAHAPRGDIHGVFATNVAFDPASARVTTRKRTFLSPLTDRFENTLTHRVDMQVDIDGDGIDDLRTVVSQDVSVGQAEDPAWLRGAIAAGFDPRWLHAAAGWYAYNVYMLQANQDGWWQPLSVYNLVTCT
ncbi:MAG TPA: SH3 domain-containing protein [Rhodocyclaceae bacterium]